MVEKNVCMVFEYDSLCNRLEPVTWRSMIDNNERILIWWAEGIHDIVGLVDLPVRIF